MQRYVILIITLILFFNSLKPQNLETKTDAIRVSKNIAHVLHCNFYINNWQFSKNNTNPWQHKNIWNAYNTMEVLIDYSVTTGDTTYTKLIRNFADNQFSYDDAKYAGYDDAQWTGIALIKAYFLTGNKEYLSRSIEMWNYIVRNSWDYSFCNGGFWWNIERTFKNAITNELFIVFTTMLYFETNENKYKDWALKTWQWFDKTEMLSLKTENNSVIYLVNDGIKGNCKNNGGNIWTYNQGVLIGGLVNLWRIFKNPTYLNNAINIANSTIDNLTEKRILVEKLNSGIISENLNTDQQQFKGIFIRYLSSLIIALPELDSLRIKFEHFIKTNCKKVNELYPDNKIGKLWHKKDNSKYHNAISQTSGLDLFISLVKIGY